MRVSQVAREFISNMASEDKAMAMLTPDAMASGGILHQPVPAKEAFAMMKGLNAAFPDLKFEVQQVSVNGNQATVHMNVSGTNTGSLALAGMNPVPPTGKKVSVPDVYVITVQGDKVAGMKVASPSDGGVPAILQKLGVRLPGM